MKLILTTLFAVAFAASAGAATTVKSIKSNGSDREAAVKCYKDGEDQTTKGLPKCSTVHDNGTGPSKSDVGVKDYQEGGKNDRIFGGKKGAQVATPGKPTKTLSAATPGKPTKEQ